MELKLKTISLAGVDEALSKAQLYRYLNEPEEAESICADVLAADPENQTALRYLGLAITDQFIGQASDRYSEVQSIFQRLRDNYERWYYMGILEERRAKAQMRAAIPARAWMGLLQDAMRHFEEAEKLRAAGNDDAILRWNRCARILTTLPHLISEQQPDAVTDEDSPPVSLPRSKAGR